MKNEPSTKEKKRILVSDHVHPHLISRFKSAGFKIDYLPDISYKAFQAVVQNYKGVIINSKIKMTEVVMDLAPDLDFIGRLGSGLDIIDLEAAEKRDIRVFAAPEGNRNAVAEHAVGMLLVLKNKLLSAHHSVQSFEWARETNRGAEMDGLTIGIIGFGHTGSQFAKKWEGWNVKVLAYDKYKKNYSDEFSFVEETTLEQVQENSDIISLHLPLTDETLYMVDAKFLQKTRKDVIIINTSRGKVLKTRDLLDALENGEVQGTCLDVLENERMDQLNSEEKAVYQKLFELENVVLSPHIAGWTHQSLFKIANVLADKILSKEPT